MTEIGLVVEGDNKTGVNGCTGTVPCTGTPGGNWNAFGEFKDGLNVNGLKVLQK